MVETSGLEPPTPWLQTRCSPIELRPQVFQRTPDMPAALWWAREESNFRPRPYQGRALAT